MGYSFCHTFAKYGPDDLIVAGTYFFYWSGKGYKWTEKLCILSLNGNLLRVKVDHITDIGEEKYCSLGAGDGAETEEPSEYPEQA